MPDNNFWNALLTTGAAMYAQNKKKKEQNKQLDWMNSILEDKRRYENEKIERYKSSPAAQMSPLIMEMLVGAYGPKFKKYGIDFPLEKMLTAIHGSGSEGGGASAGYGPAPKKSLEELSSGKRSIPWQNVAERAGIAFDKGKGYLASDGKYYATNQQAMESNRKGGTSYVMGRVDPGIEGYTGKGWTNDARAGFMGTPNAMEVGGPGEETRGSYGGGEWSNNLGSGKKFTTTGATGANITNISNPWKDMNTLSPISAGNFEGQPFSPTSIMEGDPTATAGLSSDDHTGFLERIKEFETKHPFLWKIGKWGGQLLAPGAPNIGEGAINWMLKHGVGDGEEGNAWMFNNPND